ncbi:MFS transporter [Kitasatospora phosalacinea]|uniref:MFS transporter n=1 Tax=Kitasatospora phosalacinea TaxID=2065 RepID=A0A9W6UN12_9ACTN|nr:MFS transporter [Kitasatospora phosalacinea]GLW56006.1 MFS transporter [Kitasatospora phosalacinea]
MGRKGGGGRGLGRGFTSLWSAAAVSSLGDGIVSAAAPLLVTSLTRDPVPVALSVFVQQLPWLLLAPVSGVLVDRVDRRRLTVAANAARAVLTAVLAAVVYAGAVSLPLIYTIGLLLGSCAALGDNASSALLPAVVDSTDLPRANSRMFGTESVLNRLCGPPLGAALFGVAAGLPLTVDALSFACAAALVSTLRLLPRPEPARPSPAERVPLGRQFADSARWLWRRPALRTLTLALCLMNVTLLASFSVMVLYAREHLGLSGFGYGLLLTASAVGGLAGALVAPRLQARFSASVLLRMGLVLETLTHAGLALAGSPWVAGAVLGVFGVHGAIWVSVDRTLVQRAVPDELRGRVNSAFMALAVGGSALGALLGGPIARLFGLTGPFWFSAAVMTGLTLFAWRPFGRSIDHAVPAPAPLPTAPDPVSAPT